MKLTCFLFSLVLIVSVCLSTYADSSVIHYFPVGELTLCKSCGHSHSDYWSGKFRIENLSDTDLIIYGSYFEGEFSPGGMIQRRNPDLCEWQYRNGKNKDIEWNRKSSLDKEEFVLKSKQSIEFKSGFDEFDYNKPIRFTLYSSDKSGVEPKEVFSDAFIVRAEPIIDKNGKLLDYEKPSFDSVDEACDPHCKLSIDQSPSIRGIKLGMTFEDFKKTFPKARTSKSKEKNYKIKWVWLWESNEDAYDVSLTFLDDKVARIETKFNSLKNVREKNGFYLIVADKLGLANVWTPNSSTFECRDFLVDVLSNENPTITIVTKEYLEVQDIINEQALKKI